MYAPELNLAARPVRLGLTCRALAQAADGSEAPLTRRRLEHLKMEHTELLKDISTLKADLGIAGDKSQKAAKDAEQAALDLRIFNQKNPAPADKRAKAREDPAITAERERLDFLAGDTAASSREYAEILKGIERELRSGNDSLRVCLEDQHAAVQLLEEQVAAYALGKAASGEHLTALEALNDLRGLVRGNLMVALLTVIVVFDKSGRDAALETLTDLMAVFSQHEDPLARVLDVYLRLGGNKAFGARELGMFTADQFSHPGFFRLYQLTRALAGSSTAVEALRDDPFSPTLWVIDELNRTVHDQDGSGLMDQDELAAWAAGGDVVVRTMAAHALLLRGHDELVMKAAGIEAGSIATPIRRNDSWPELGALLAPSMLRAWPDTLAGGWVAALASLVLYCARDRVPEGLFEAWLNQSYNWPKSDLYWWVLSELRGDPTLLRNLTCDSSEMFTVNR